MTHFRSHDGILFLLLIITALPGCDEPPPPAQDAAGLAIQAPATVTAHTPPVAVNPAPDRMPKKPGARPRTATSLKLTIDELPAEEPSPAGFGRYSAPNWLEAGRTNGNDPATAPGTGPALPGLFEQPAASNPVTVEGELLLDDTAEGRVPRVQGAGLSLELRTR